MNKCLSLLILLSVLNSIYVDAAAAEPEEVKKQFEVYLKNGRQLVEDAKYDKALVQFEKARQLSPTDPRLYSSIFFVHWRKHDGEAALRFLQEVPPLPKDHEAYIQYLNLFVYAYGLISNTEKKEEYLQKIIELDAPDTVENLIIKGKANCDFRRYEDALDCYKGAAKAIDENTSDHAKGTVFWSLGHVQIQLKHYDEAIVHFEEGLKHRSFAQGYDSLGTAYRKNGDFENARRNYAKALEIDKLLDNAWAGMGRCHRAEGDLKQAKEYLQKGIELNPHHWQSRQHLIHVLIDENNIAAAHEHIAILKEQAKGSEIMQKRIAKCLERIEKL